MATYDENEMELTLNEYELHDVIAALSHIGNVECDFRGHVDRIKIVPFNPDDPNDTYVPADAVDLREHYQKYKNVFTPELIGKWEDKIRALVTIMCELDADYHDDAEHTC